MKQLEITLNNGKKATYQYTSPTSLMYAWLSESATGACNTSPKIIHYLFRLSLLRLKKKGNKNNLYFKNKEVINAYIDLTNAIYHLKDAFNINGLKNELNNLEKSQELIFNYLILQEELSDNFLKNVTCETIKYSD